MIKTIFHDNVRRCDHGEAAEEKMLDTELGCVLMDYDSYDFDPTLQDFLEDENDGERVFDACKATYNASIRCLKLREYYYKKSWWCSFFLL